ncbi:hypothetical protein [Streptococcus sp. OH4692_COT-348]|uniref:hypothetical protein n=1 Tax=Streptococcus sp. OH4692_COT-348 TaxID=2491052 RepID=UPI000F5E00C6|nr:hypothetical protein [Streptococcus sp. OH4692_COT-348]RRD33237.1 hypothetical protein EII37_07315 [Streptococcus sp. OH4692_COT-348]
MTKETKNAVSAETIVENLKEFANKLHDNSKDGMLHFLLKGDIRKFKIANVFHNLSHDLLDILDGKSAKEVLEETDGNEEDSSLVGTIAINVETGNVEGLDGIKDTKVKEQILAAVSKVVEELGGN